MAKGLFERWLALEMKNGNTLKQVLDEINGACSTAYRHNWPAKVAARGYSLERMPDCVRRYMMRRVLPDVLAKRCQSVTKKDIEALIDCLT